MTWDAVPELVKLAIPPVLAALVTAVARESLKLVRERRKRNAGEGGSPLVLPPGVEPPRRPGQLGGGIVRPLRRGAELVWNLIYRLPPLKRRASPWKATLLGGPLVAFGIAGYFRTAPDVVVGILLTIPFFIAVGFLPEASGESAAQSNDASRPFWAYAIAYTSMALTGAYSYLRALTSNRRLEASLPTEIGPKSAAERKMVLTREIHILAGQGWRLESMSEFEAVVSRIKGPKHALHLVLALLTVWLWSAVWITLTIASRRKRELEYRRIFVDVWGNCKVEVAKSPPQAGPPAIH